MCKFNNFSNEPVTPRRWSMNEASMLPGNSDKDMFVPMLPNVPASPMITNQTDAGHPANIVTVVVDQSSSNDRVPSMPPLTAIDPKRNNNNTQQPIATQSRYMRETTALQSNNMNQISNFQTLQGQFVPERPTTLPTAEFSGKIPKTTVRTGLTPLSAMSTSLPSTPANFTAQCDKKLVNLSPGTVDLILNEEFEKKNDTIHSLKQLDVDLSLKSLSFKSPSSSDEVLTMSPGGTTLIIRNKDQHLEDKQPSFSAQNQMNFPSQSNPMHGIVPPGNFNKDFERYENSALTQENNKLYNNMPSPSSKFYNGSVLLSESQIEESSGGHFVPMYGEDNSTLFSEHQEFHMVKIKNYLNGSNYIFIKKCMYLLITLSREDILICMHQCRYFFTYLS